MGEEVYMPNESTAPLIMEKETTISKEFVAPKRKVDDVVVKKTTSDTYSDTAEDYEAYQNIISNYFTTLTQE